METVKVKITTIRIEALKIATTFAFSPEWTVHELIALAKHIENYLLTGDNSVAEKVGNIHGDR